MLSRSINIALSLISVAAIIIYSQPPSPNGGLYQSSWWDPNGTDYDQYVWDNFMLSSSQAISEIRWRGGYDPAKFGSGGPVLDFRVAIYASIPAGTQPDITNPPLMETTTGGNAGQTPAGTFGGIAMYDYRFSLPTPFQASVGVKYWLQIEATQHGIPDWGITVGTGGDGYHFRRMVNYPGGNDYRLVPGDAAFTVLAPQNYSFWVYLPVTMK